MQIKIFTLSLSPSEEELEELNLFLRSHKIVECRKEMVVSGMQAYWSFCVVYLPKVILTTTQIQQSQKNGKVDYKEVLSDEAFARFVELRQLRKQVAMDDAVPAYAVFTDAELAEMAKLEVITEAELKKIPGVGAKRIEKYGVKFCASIPKSISDETDGILD